MIIFFCGIQVSMIPMSKIISKNIKDVISILASMFHNIAIVKLSNIPKFLFIYLKTAEKKCKKNSWILRKTIQMGTLTKQTIFPLYKI